MILLDTHILLWWLDSPEKLSSSANAAITAAYQDRILVSSFSAWEIAMLISKDRLRLSIPVEIWLKKVEAIPFISFIPTTNDILIKSVFLSGTFHPDPADRIIVATALSQRCPLVTADEKIRDYNLIETIW